MASTSVCEQGGLAAVAIAVPADAGEAAARATRASLRGGTVTRAEFAVVETRAGEAACIEALLRLSSASVLVVLQAGALVGPGWLEAILAAFQRDERTAVVIASSVGHTPPAIVTHCGPTQPEVTAAAANAGRRFGLSVKAYEHCGYTPGVCVAVRRRFAALIGAAYAGDDVELGWPARVIERARAAGLGVTWARGAFVHPGAGEIVGSGELPPLRNAPRPLRQDAPLVSCIMPTRGREALALRAIEYFRRQDYPAVELIVVGEDDDALVSRLPDDPRIRVTTMPTGESIGAKRNRACALARGEIIAHWDDDDWHGAQRISAQVAPILAGRADIVGLTDSIFLDLEAREAWSCVPALHRRLFEGDVHGATLVYRRWLWDTFTHFPHRSLAEDACFLRRLLQRGCRLERLPASGLYVYIRHAGNSWPFRCGHHVDPSAWRRLPRPPMPAADWSFYRSRRSRGRAPTPVAHVSIQEQPLVSCIMPTRDRRWFAQHAIRCFLQQDYERRELVVIDDGADPIEDLLQSRQHVLYRRLDAPLVVGDKRNLACQLARGALIAHWDDDDWSNRHRLTYQVTALQRADADICGTRRQLYLDIPHDRAWLFEYPRHRLRPLVGGSLCYRKQVWARHGFESLASGEDVRFLHGAHARNSLALPDHRFSVATIHEANTSAKLVADTRWRPEPLSSVRNVMGSSLELYRRRDARP